MDGDGLTLALMVMIVGMSAWVYSERQATRRARKQRDGYKEKFEQWHAIAVDEMWAIRILKKANEAAATIVNTVVDKE